MKNNRWGLNRSQRMQLKAFICVLGLLLIIILLLGKLLLMLVHRGEDREELPEPSPHIPVVRQLTNVWITEVDEEGLSLFRDGNSERYLWGTAATEVTGPAQLYRADSSVREQVADVELTDDRVTFVSAKTDKINGRILSADDTGIEVEGYGRLPLAADYRGYRLYDTLSMCTARDVRFGYNFTDLCVENGEVCGVLMAKEEAMEYIRVLIKASDYSGSFHDEPVVTCDVDK